MIGIYAIKNALNGKAYVGLTTKANQRFLFHKRRLRDGTHKNGHLQSSFNKYGKEAFEFVILEECSENELFEKEKIWIAKLNTCNRTFGYNKTHGGEFGRLHPDIYKKYSERLKGGTISEEQKEKIRKTLTGRNQPKDVVAKRALSNRKLSLSQEDDVKLHLIKGRRPVDIAKLYNVNLNTIRGVVNRNFEGSITRWRKQNQDEVDAI